MPYLVDTGLFSVIDLDSSIGVGWKLGFFVEDTSTELDSYPTRADAVALTNANANPVIIPSDGRIPPCWINADAKAILYDENDVVKETIALILDVPGDGDAGDDTAVSAIEQGTHTIPVLAGSMLANITNGPSSGTSESAVSKVMLRTLDFDQSTDESAQITIPMPKSWDEGTVTVQFIWTATTTGTVIWGCSAIALSDDDAVDTAFGSAQTVTDAVTAANDVMESAFSAAITIGGTPAAEDIVNFKFYRDADAGGDTLAADAKLIGVRIKYTLNAATDA